MAVGLGSKVVAKRGPCVYRRLIAHRSMSALIALLAVLVLGVASTMAAAAITLAATTALINGASGLPNRQLGRATFRGVAKFLLAPNTDCQPMTCLLVPVNGPETTFPFIGGLSGLTFDKSVAEGIKNLNLEYQAVRAADPTGKIVIFGYS